MKIRVYINEDQTKGELKIVQLYKNESALIRKASIHDRDAQRTLFEMYAPKMLSVCRYYISDLQQAEEAMLNGFYKVFSKVKDYSGKGSFEGWIRRIMVRESISYIRSLKKVEFTPEEFDVNDYSNNINVAMGVAEIQYLIDALPDGYRMVFVMYAIEGYKHQEISETLHISVGTSKSQLFKARKLLQSQLQSLNSKSHVTN